MSSANSSWLLSWLSKRNGNGHQAASSAASVDDHVFGLADEQFFNRMLCLERKRAERTGDPFVLMLVDLGRLAETHGFDCVERVCASIQSQMRETDLPGWYEHPVTVGIVYTALCGTERTLVRSALLGKADQALAAALDPAERSMVDVTLHFFPEDFGGNKTDFRSDETLYPDVKQNKRSSHLYPVMKRAMDLVVSLACLIIFAPLLAVISLLIKLTSEGPVLYRQKRLGKFGKQFWFLKFRTMHVNSSHQIHEQYVKKLIQKKVDGASGPKPVYKIANDPRVTPLGHFLRKSSLDELPQLLNVLKGEMSLVGPRPPIPYEVSCYEFWHRRRVIGVKPGITGLWQVDGRSRTTFDDMVRLDLRYVRDQSLWLDLKILMKTPWAVLSASGAY